ncbi:MAG: CAP domain-containing protein [Chthoniobacteraceae bacterium]
MQSLTIPHGGVRLSQKSILAALLGALMWCSGPQRAAAVELNAEEQQLAARLTGDRGQRRDRSRMHADPILTAVARARAEDMATRRYFSHVNPDGIGPNYLVRSAGYVLPSSWGSRSGNFIESIGAGYATAEEAWTGWMNSSSHRTHLLASSSFYRDQVNFGIGSYSDPSSPYRRYWVIITAPPSSRSEAAFASRRPAKPARVAVAMPIFSNVDPDAGEVRDEASEPAPRPSAPRPDAGEKLWNWEGPVAAPRPTAPRLINAG